MLTYSTLPGPADLKPLNLALILEHAQSTFYHDLLLRLTPPQRQQNRLQEFVRQILLLRKVARLHVRTRPELGQLHHRAQSVFCPL